MMKTIQWILGFVAMAYVMSSSLCRAQEWATTYGGSGSEVACSVEQVAGGGYMLAGYTSSFGAGSYDVWLLKLSSAGAVTWEKSCGGTGNDVPESMQQTVDGGCIVSGYTTSFNVQNEDMWILKLDSNGAIEWQKTYGGSSGERANAIRQTFDQGGNPDGYIVAGYSISFGGWFDFWVLRLHLDGTVEWQKTYGGDGHERASCVAQSVNESGVPDGYIVAGRARSLSADNGDFWAVKLDTDGDIDWQKTYGGSSEDTPESVQQTADGGYIVAGSTYSFGATHSAFWVLKLNANGTVDWQKTYRGSDGEYLSAIQQTPSDNGYVMVGITYSFVPFVGEFSTAGVWVLKLHSDGTVAWERTFNGNEFDQATTVRQTASGGYVVAGYTRSFGAGSNDIWVLSLDANGQIPNCGIMGTSSAIVSNTAAVVADTSVLPAVPSPALGDTTVSLQDTSANTSEQCAAPDADFTASPIGGTAPLTVQFTDQSTGVMTSWSWDFGDGGISAEQNPSYTFETEGDFTVSLTVDGPFGGDTETRVEYIHVRYGPELHVWPDPTLGATPIQDAIGIAVDSDVIIVHDGTYVENIDFQGKAITVASENGPQSTIIDGGGYDDGGPVPPGPDTVVRFVNGEGAGSVLEGFTITKGESDPSGDAGGILCSGTSPTITNCIITNNTGHGIQAAGAYAAPSISDCTISYNTGGWGSGINLYDNLVSSATITNCIIGHNSGDWCGAGIYAFRAHPIITDCIIRNNDGGSGIGGGVFLMSECSATITGCTISGNAAGDGAGIYMAYGPDPVITNCVISDNTAGRGGGIHADDAELHMMNCTIVDNTATQYGGGIYYTDSAYAGHQPTVVNSILWGNTADGNPNEIYLDYEATIDISYSDIQGGWPGGAGNMDCSPDFVGVDDYHLLPYSCCVDAGTSNGAPSHDIDGQPRPQGDGYDVGADEYAIHTGVLTMDREVYPPSGNVNIVLMDGDLNTDAMTREQYSGIVTVSTAGGDQEASITMIETGIDTSVFTGAISIVAGAVVQGDGSLQIDCYIADVITAAYDDAYDGTGPATVSDTADTDCSPPLITNVGATDVGYTVATVRWDTDELADSCVYYGTTTALGLSKCEASLVTDHAIHPSGLLPDTTYYFAVASADEAGNQTIDDNNGQYYQFHTSPLATQWAMTYGGGAHDTVYSIKQTFDQRGDPDGYIAAGSTYSFANGQDDVWAVRLDLSGGVVWEKSYGTNTFEWAVSVDQTADGGYFLVGNSYYHNYDGRDFWVLKLNPSGSVAWQNIYGLGTGDDYAHAAQEVFDPSGNADGYIVVGSTASFAAGEGDVWVLKLNPSGGITWQRTYGGTDYDAGYAVQQTSDGGYMVAGVTESFAGTDRDMWVLKLNQDGTPAWQKAYDSGQSERANTIRQTSDGGYIVAGETTACAEPCLDVLVFKLDPEGAVMWSKTYSAPSQDDAKSIRETPDGHFILAGWTIPAGGGAQQFWLLKLNSADGSVLWQKTYGGAGHEGANTVQATVDGGFIVGGSSHSFGEGNSDMWILKLDADGEIPGCNVSTPGDGVAAAATITVADTDASVVGSFVTPTSTGVAAQQTSASTLDSCAAPMADFSGTPTSGDKPLEVTFTDGSTGAIESWSWDFGDGETSPDQHPSHTYTDGGDFTVTLTVTGPGGEDTKAREAYIHVSEPLCECQLVPDATTIPRGGTVSFEATVTNNTDLEGMVHFVTFLTPPLPYTRFPASGWLDHYTPGMTPYGSKSGHISHTIPFNWPLGTYYYHGRVGQPGPVIYDECWFEFEVVEP